LSDHSPRRSAIGRVAGVFRLRGPLAGEPAARVLNTLLVWILIWVSVCTLILVPLFAARKLGALALGCGWALTAVISRYLLRRGLLRQSAIVYVIGTWLVSTLLIVPSGGIRSPFLVMYVALPISAAWLLGQRETLWTAAGCMASVLLLGLMEASGLGPYLYFPGRPLVAWIVMANAILIASVPVAQILRTLRDSLAQSELDQEALRQERDLLARVMETSPAGILALDREGQIRFANAQGALALGVAPDEVRRRSFNSAEWKATTYEGQPMPYEQMPFIQTRTRREATFGIPIAIQPADKRILLSVNTAPLADAAGEFDGMVASIEDVTERRRIEEQLRESELRFRTMADTVPAGIVLLNQAGHPTYTSKWLLTFFGVTLEQLVADEWLWYVHPEDVDRLGAEIAAAGWERRLSQIEHRLRRSDGEYRWVAATASPRFIHGEFAGHIVVILDITAIKQAQEYALANQKLESLGVLAAGIAHDFNTFLGTILSNADLALLEIPVDSQAYESVSTITAVANRAAVIVKLMLDYAGGEEAGAFDEFDLSSVIEDMVGLLQLSIPRTTSLSMNLSSNLPHIWASAAQIRQVVMNLVINASEALQAKAGTVTISTSHVRVGQEPIELRPPSIGDGAYVLLEVADTGCGMTEEIRTRIFDPFFSNKFFGRGLGLASVQGIMRVMGGAIGVVTAPGAGSTFKVWLPYSNRQTNTGRSAPQRPRVAGTVLLVDDQDSLRQTLAPALKREGFSVLDEHDGLAAIQRFAQHAREIDAVVLDLTLPGLSSDDVCSEVRRLKPEVPVLFTGALDTGVADGPGLHATQRSLQKPCRLEDLMQAVRELVAIAGSQDHPAGS
jgi:two-component system cell cycle sensor histidine kinase/response regulator CckA